MRKPRLIPKFIVSLFILLNIPIFATEPKVVSHLDLLKYQGQWFEIARFPNPFQKKCQKNVTARYRLLEDGFIEVINSCEQKGGAINSVTGLAKQQSPESTSKLGVSFFDIFGWRPVWGDYWVLDIDADYQVAVVGDQNRKYGWVLARNTSLSKIQTDRALSAFDKNGYDSQKLIFTAHD